MRRIVALVLVALAVSPAAARATTLGVYGDAGRRAGKHGFLSPCGKKRARTGATALLLPRLSRFSDSAIDRHEQRDRGEETGMRLIAKTLAFGAACVLVLAVSGVAGAAAPVPCSGTVQLTSTSNTTVRQADGQTVVEFDFTGLHTLCLADGSVVTGTVVGHLVQRTSTDGDMTLRFAETLFYAGGTLGYSGEASLAGGNWQSHVQTVGAGTGPLAGIQGQGSFSFTGPASLVDEISYVYAP